VSKQFRNDFKGSLIIPVGWLFADLLLALAMLFLLANTIDTPTKAKLATPTPVVKLDPTPRVTVSPTPIQRILESTYCKLSLNLDDPNRFMNDKQYAINTLEPQITGQSVLQHRQVGLAIAYGGANSSIDITIAQSIANQVYEVLRDLGNKGSVFKITSYYGPLYNLGDSPNAVELDVYLLVRSGTGNTHETCDAKNHQPL
jgi:hypothetical protein